MRPRADVEPAAAGSHDFLKFPGVTVLVKLGVWNDPSNDVVVRCHDPPDGAPAFLNGQLLRRHNSPFRTKRAVGLLKAESTREYAGSICAFPAQRPVHGVASGQSVTGA